MDCSPEQLENVVWILQIYIYLVARRDVLRFEMSHRQKIITATVRDQISASSGPSRKEVRGGSWLSQCNLREAVLMNKDVDESHVVYKMFRKFNICLLKGFCHIELDLVLELLNFEFCYFLARKCYCLEQSLLNLSTIVVQLEDILW